MHRLPLVPASILALLAATTAVYAQAPVADAQHGLLISKSQVQVTGGTTYQFVPGTGYVVTIPAGGTFHFSLPEKTNWTGASHAVISMKSNDSEMAWLSVQISSGTGESVRIGGNVAVGTAALNSYAFPLFDAASTGMGVRSWSTPANLKAAQMLTTGKFEATNFRRVRLMNVDSGTVHITVAGVTAASTSLLVSRMSDDLFEANFSTWTGKLTSVAQLTATAATEARGASIPSGDIYGSNGSPVVFAPASRYSLKKWNGHWWFITPNGQPMISMGANEVGAAVVTPIQGRSTLFTTLPAATGAFSSHYSYATDSTGKSVQALNVYSANLQRKYGTDWKNSHYAAIASRFSSWGLNTLGANSDFDLITKRTIPFTLIYEVGGAHKTLNVVQSGGSAKMPDPYDPTYVTDAVAGMKWRITTHGSVALNIGTFVDNELPWGDGLDPQNHYAIVRAALAGANNQPAKIAMVNYLVGRYGIASSWVRAWGIVGMNTWNDALAKPITFDPTNPAIQNDLKAMTLAYARTYFKAVRQSLNNLGYKGLYLGCRFATNNINAEAVQALTETADALSVNSYEPTLGTKLSWLQNLDFPMIVSEFGYSSSSEGRMPDETYPCANGDDQAQAQRRFVINALGWKNVVGLHWYRWEDLPVTGAPQGHNESMGIVSVCDVPYTKLTANFTSFLNTITNMTKTGTP